MSKEWHVDCNGVPMFRLLPRILLALACAIALAAGPDGNKAPSSATDATDIFSAFRLPTLADSGAGSLQSVLSTTQAGRRARMLSLTGRSAMEAWSAADKLIGTESTPACATGTTMVRFSGKKASALNLLLASEAASVEVTADSLSLDEPIEIHRNRVTLDLGHARLQIAHNEPYVLRIESATCVTVRGGEFMSSKAGILITHSAYVHVEHAELHDLSSSGIVVTSSFQVVLRGNTLHGISGAPVVLHRGTHDSLVIDNNIVDNRGPSNFTAAILITDREVDLTADPNAIFASDGYWSVSQPIEKRLHPPHDNLILRNRIAANAASGIYVDGGVRNVIASNTVEANAKEGLCLDNGSTANVVVSNSVERNGDRWGETDRVLESDHVLAAGRIEDGTSAAKLPGISIDNALYNVVFKNHVEHNQGGGVKIVRTGYFNVIGMNMIVSNNDGASPSFHFFGVELGSTVADAASNEIDFTPSRGNLVFSNLVRGGHYAGIFLGAGSDRNEVFDNTILDATNWGLESVAVMDNRTLNNLTNLPSRNIGSGMDPQLLKIGQAVVDGPGH
jgi:parallel beta-helix repeat protein